MQGQVKFFNQQKGFGFIAPLGGGKDIFVHYTGIVGNGHRNLEDGQTVEFETAEGDKGPKAVNVRALSL